MFKFNVGDRVKVIAYSCENQLFGYGPLMPYYVGSTYVIIAERRSRGYRDPDDRRGYCLRNDEGGRIPYIWDERLLRRTRKAKIQPPTPPKKEEPAPAIPEEVVAPPVPVLATPSSVDTPLHKKMIVDLKNNTDSGGICGFVVGYEDGSTYVYKNAPCHAEIGGMYKVEPQRVALLLDLPQHKKRMSQTDYAKTYEAYVKYIMTESPRASCFHYQGMDHAWENGVLMNTDRPIEELAGAAVALREGTEYYTKLPMFQKILDAGFSGNVAYILSYCVSSDMRWLAFNDSHKSMTGVSDFSGIIKFFKRGYYRTDTLPPYNKSKNNYQGISKWCAYGAAAGASLNQTLERYLDVTGKASWDYTSIVSEENLLKTANILEKLLS